MTESTASLNGVRLKVERAKKHLVDLDTVIVDFGKSHPYTFVVKKNLKTGEGEHNVVKVAPVPVDVATISGDLVHNLRSALDHLIWQLVIANGGKPEEKPRAYAFPIWDSKAEYETQFPGKAHGISKSALNLLRRLQPYKGGDGDALWRIHHLDIVDKHRLLLTVNTAQTGITLVGDHLLWDRNVPNAPVERVAASPDAPATYVKQTPTPIRAGAVLASFAADDESHDDTKFIVSVSLDEPAIGGLEPLFPALGQLVDATEAVVALFEAEIG